MGFKFSWCPQITKAICIVNTKYSGPPFATTLCSKIQGGLHIYRHSKQSANMIVCSRLPQVFCKSCAIQMDSDYSRHQVVDLQVPSGNPFFGRSWELKCLWARVATAFKRSVRANWCLFFVLCVCLRWLKIKGGNWKSTIYRGVSHQRHLKYSPSHEVLLENCFPVPWAFIPNKWGSISP